MKVVKRYVCEICGETYETEEDALECEKHHDNCGIIVRMIFDHQHSFPYEIGVRYRSGDIVTYCYAGEVIRSAKHDSD